MIDELTLNTPTLHGVRICPGTVNFFYGKNGTGKSSATLAIGEQKVPDAAVLVYNEQYIEQNVRSYGNIPGVYAISRDNVRIRQQIEEAEAEKARMDEQMQTLLAAVDGIKTELDESREAGIAAIWRAASEFRRKYPKVLEQYGEDPDGFAQRISGTEAADYSDEEIRQYYEIGYFGKEYNGRFYEEIPADILPRSELLDIPIVSHADFGFSVFIETLGNIDWLQEGHTRFGHAAGRKCPYCGASLPDGFEESFAALLDEKYRDKMAKLEAFAEAYKAAAGEIRQIIETNRMNPFRTQSKPVYPLIAEALLSGLEKNLGIIRRKLEHPREELYIDDLRKDIQRLNHEADDVNALIKRHMDTAHDLPGARRKAEALIWQRIAWECREIVTLCRQEQNRKSTELWQMRQRAADLDQRIIQAETAIRKYRGQLADTSAAMEAINGTLQTSGFTGFALKEKEDEPNAYVLVRKDGNPAAGLSEGERKFVAFLYFYHMVTGTLSRDGKKEPKIVVIDDPVCSLDSEVMSFVASLVRSMIRTCLERTRNCEKPEETGIVQMFCFTHNPVFFRMISDLFLPDNDHCLFYEVKKDRENVSTIVPCLEECEVPGGKRRNRSPVTDEYHGLWRRFALSEDAHELVSVGRNILCHYFILTCHHDERNIARIVLQGNEQVFRNGHDHMDYNIASSLISLMDLSAEGAMKSMFFDVDAVDVSRIRFVMKRIFEIMNQEQHYSYMMKTVCS